MVGLICAVLLHFFAVGGVRGFAFALGVTTVIDLIVIFFFTKPMLTLIAKSKFFSSGHRFSGFSAKSIGLKESADGNTKIAQTSDVKSESVEAN
jgi:preprotein translocase subunit SecD